jgi:mRNA interferase MazF
MPWRARRGAAQVVARNGHHNRIALTGRGGGRERTPARSDMTTNLEAPADERRPKICRGDLFWVGPGDAPELAPSYAHPHVVVQDDVFNHSRVTTVIVCALTSNLRRATEPGNVLLEAGEGGLPRQSVVIVSQIASVDKARLGARIGSLSAERVDQILAGLRFQQASFFGR